MQASEKAEEEQQAQELPMSQLVTVRPTCHMSSNQSEGLHLIPSAGSPRV